MNPAFLLTVLGGISGWVLGSATGARPWFVAMVAAVVAFEATSAAEVEASRLRSWRRAEILMLVVGVKALHLLTIPRATASEEIAAFPLGLLDVESVTGWVVGLSVWLLVVATVSDLNQIGTGVERGEEVPALDRLRYRLMTTTVLLVAAAAFGAVGVLGLLDLERSGRRGVFWAVVVFFGIGLLGLGRAGFSNAAGRWEREGVLVEGPVRSRWLASGALVVLLVVTAGVVTSAAGSGLSGLPAVGVSRMGPVGDWLVGALDRLGGGEARPTGEGGGLVPPLQPREAAEGEPGSFIGELFILAVLATSVAVALRAGGGSRTRRLAVGRGGGALWRLVLAMARGLTAMVTSIVRAMWTLLQAVFRIRRRGGQPERSKRRAGNGISTAWNPEDPLRRRVANAYRRFVGGARTAGFTRRPVDTPREFAERVGGSKPVETITSSYEEARYSRHELAAADAERAEQAAAAAIAEIEGR